MSVEQYSLVAHDWLNLEFIINDLASRVIGQELGTGSSPTWVGATLTGLTASSLVAADANKALESVTIGSSLSYSRPTLNTIQGIRVTDTPIFAGYVIKDVVETVVVYSDENEFYITEYSAVTPGVGNPIGLALVLTYAS